MWCTAVFAGNGTVNRDHGLRFKIIIIIMTIQNNNTTSTTTKLEQARTDGQLGDTEGIIYYRGR